MTNTVLLLHGAWAANWVWEPIIGLLQAAGLKVIAPTLPGQTDGTPASEISLDNYVNFIVDLIEKESTEPVSLVGHSGSGMVISQVAEARPDLVESLVYVAGFMLPSGMTFPALCDDVYGEGVGVGASLEVEFDEAGDYVWLETKNLHSIFFNCTSTLVSAPLIKKLQAHPVSGWNLVNDLSESHFGAVLRHYIYLNADNSVPALLQDRMLALTPGARVHQIDTDHVPQVSAPDQLSSVLIEICQAVSL
ncbi:MAG: pimeloyl-ACP methyl ester carboxylesterase [Candidatus Azotimanducaceae bacterium]|jgi:pimeloyl-ACP methyl ester carboxylesterase